MREQFLAELNRMGNWPAVPVKIGVANGVATGQGNGIKPGDHAVEGKGLSILGTHLYAQRGGDNQIVATLRLVTPPPAKEVPTDDLPEIDGAPGGTLEGFGILADKLNEQSPILGLKTSAHIRHHSFVPSVSAVAIRDVTTDADLYANIDGLNPETSELDHFQAGLAERAAHPDDHGARRLDRRADREPGLGTRWSQPLVEGCDQRTRRVADGRQVRRTGYAQPQTGGHGADSEENTPQALFKALTAQGQQAP
ncbi:hypothetical protein [Streptomyces cirratus]|uniref:hypothetical protein n=1 Tax=Streptomyces cirratus TaxID=68187 RepID=UPI003618D20D